MGISAQVKMGPLNWKVPLKRKKREGVWHLVAFHPPDSNGFASQNRSSVPCTSSSSSITGPKQGSSCCMPIAKASIR